MDENIKKRFLELAKRSYMTGTYTFTDFLGMSEQSDFWQIEKEVSYAGYHIYGGYDDAERVMIRFGKSSEFGYETDFPIVCIHITPLMKKFSDDLTHRDFLGALMNLGIERSTLGDIKVKENEAFIFCSDSLSQYISDNLTRIKHTSVNTVMTDNKSEIEKFLGVEELLSKQITVSSLRVDGIVSKVYNLSRNDSLILFRSQKIFVNGRLMEDNGRQVKNGDVISVRGYGKFKLTGEPSCTRKGRLSVNVQVW